MKFCCSAALVLCLAMTPGVTQASIYTVSHNSDGYGQTGPSDFIQQGTPIDYEFEFQPTYFIPNSNYGEVYANVSQGSIGIYARTQNFGGYAVQRQEVTASFTFDVFFSSPTNDEISVSLNLDLSGTLQSVANGGGSVFAQVGTVNQAGQQFSSGWYSENNGEVTRSGMLSNFSDSGSKQTITTSEFILVPVNVATSFSVTLGTIQGYGLSSNVIDFGNTFNLTTVGDVFTVRGPNAELITVNSDDAGIYDNRYGQSAVPEPSSVAVFAGIGVLGLFGYGWRKRSRRAGLAATSLKTEST